MKQIIIALLLTFNLYATNWYVRPVTGEYGLENGTSWDNAFDGFLDIAWGSISAGDTVFISGGADTTYYYETLTPEASGSFGNQIIITPGNDTGHDGVVVINGQSTRDNNILIDGTDTAGYIKVDGQHRLVLIGAGDIQILITGSGSRHLDYITIEACSLTVPNDAYNGQLRVVGTSGTYKARYILIRDNYIMNDANVNACDRIVFFYTENVWIDKNILIGNNTLAGSVPTPYCHDDCIQSYFGNYNLIISNNYLYDGQVADYHQLIMMEDMDGVNVIYNNVLYMPNKEQWGNTFLDKGDNGYNAKYYVIHNTAISGSNRNQFDTGADTMTAYNNLFTCTSEPHAVVTGGDLPGGAGVAFESTPDWTKIQGNHFGEKFVEGSGWKNYTLTTMNGYGAETFGNSATRWRTDPLIYGDDANVYPNEDFHPTESSPLRDNGIYDLGGGQTVQALVESLGWSTTGDYLEWVDIEGNPRDDTPDIGAYQYIDSGLDTTAVFSFADVTNAALNTEYIATSPITGIDTVTHFWTTTSADFKINYNGTYNTAMKEANPDNGADTAYIKNTSSGTNSTTTTETIVGGGISRSFDVTTLGVSDTIPSAFTFIDLGYADISTAYTSFPFMLTGFDSSNAYFGGDNFAIKRSGSWGSPSATQRKIYSTDSLRITKTSSGSYNTAVNQTFTAGGVTDVWYITTKGNGEGIDTITVQNVEGETDEALHPPSKVIDGLLYADDQDSRWAANPLPQTFIFDLSSTETVVKLDNSFAFWQTGRTYVYSIDISNDYSNWYRAVPQKTSTAGEWTEDSLTVGYNIRYVRVNFVSNNQASIWAGLFEGVIQGDGSTAIPTDTIPTISFTDVIDAEYDSIYTTSGVFQSADSTFWVTAGTDSFKIGALDTYKVGWDTAHVSDTAYVKKKSANSASVTLTLTLTAGGSNSYWNVTTKADASSVRPAGRFSNGQWILDSTGKAIKIRR